jgi:hypothetical protein
VVTRDTPKTANKMCYDLKSTLFWESRF